MINDSFCFYDIVFSQIVAIYNNNADSAIGNFTTWSIRHIN